MIETICSVIGALVVIVVGIVGTIISIPILIVGALAAGVINGILSDSPDCTFEDNPSMSYEVTEQRRSPTDASVNVKAGVNLNTLQPDMESAIETISTAYKEVLGDDYEPTITSGNDYDGHRENSAHYSGAALDFRLKDIEDADQREMVTIAVREALGDQFFVDHEFPGEENEHLHVQLRKGTYPKVAER